MGGREAITTGEGAVVWELLWYRLIQFRRRLAPALSLVSGIGVRPRRPRGKTVGGFSARACSSRLSIRLDGKLMSQGQTEVKP